VLHLLTRRKVVLPGRTLGLLADPLPAAEGGEGRVGEPDPLGEQLLMDPDQVALAR